MLISEELVVGDFRYRNNRRHTSSDEAIDARPCCWDVEAEIF